MRSSLYYFLGTVFIGVWWYAAFSQSPGVSCKTFHSAETTSSSVTVSNLAPIDRNVLHQALSGNVELMTRLIADWDIDAQLLKLTGYAQVHRLPKHKYLRSQVLGRQLLSEKAGGSKKILPQTYVAASFLLALVEPSQIIALPAGLRNYTHLFPKNITAKIPLDLDRYNAETLYLAQPEIAFAASYSNPALMQTLKNQNIPLAILKGTNHPEEILSELKWIGALVEQPLKAEMLSLFMEAAMQAIDNRLLLVQSYLKLHDLAKRIVLVNYHEQLFLPSQNTLSYQLLKHLNIANTDTQDDTSPEKKWSSCIHSEYLIHLDPCCLIIAAANIDDAKAFIGHNRAFGQLNAWKTQRIFFIDETVQQFASQYLVLAYYDIAQALLQSKFL